MSTEKQNPDCPRCALCDGSTLSPRLYSVWIGVKTGHTSAQIAARLGISKSAVHAHRNKLNRHLGIIARDELLSENARKRKAASLSNTQGQTTAPAAAPKQPGS